MQVTLFSVVDKQAALGLEDATKAAFALEVAMQETTVQENTMQAIPHQPPPVATQCQSLPIAAPR